MSATDDFDPLNVCATVASGALRRNDAFLGEAPRVQALAAQIAPGFRASSQYDLSYFSGRTVSEAEVVPVFIGGDATQSGAAASWAQSDMTAIEDALRQALWDGGLESVIAQYFASAPRASLKTSVTYTDQATSLQQSDVEALVQSAWSGRTLTATDPAATLFCLMLSPGTRLFATDGADSLNGLGGYHGSVAADGTTIYYAVGVYSQTEGSITNGIPAFEAPWKNVVATFYHEINEWRTDPDVESVQGNNVSGVLGWYSVNYGEIGDIPIVEAAGNLSEVFIEVTLSSGSGTVPVQLMYSNFDHGPARTTSAPVGSALPQGGG